MLGATGRKPPPIRHKNSHMTIAERNRTISRILTLIQTKNVFLLIGHEFPDEDCIASLVSLALFIRKFSKHPIIYIRDQVQEQLSYLLDICAFNKIKVCRGVMDSCARPDAVFVLDTPKPEMVAGNSQTSRFIEDPSIPKAEIDHHFSADAAYSGDEGLCLVSRASSTCELIGYMACKLQNDPSLQGSFDIPDLFSRNLVLSILTGMIGDSKGGIIGRSRRDAFFHEMFLRRFGELLRKQMHKNSMNFRSIDDIFATIQSLSVEEKDLYEHLMQKARFVDRVGCVSLDEHESQNFLSRVDYSVFVNVIKTVTDELCEQSGAIGLTAYYEHPDVSNLVQFRIRASRSAQGIDLRAILDRLGIKDGGGHPGAIGFRVPKAQIRDFPAFVVSVLEALRSL